MLNFVSAHQDETIFWNAGHTKFPEVLWPNEDRLLRNWSWGTDLGQGGFDHVVEHITTLQRNGIINFLNK